MKKFTASLVTLGLLVLLAQALPSLAQRYPTKPVRIIVPTPVGGPGDIVARGTALALGQVFDQSFIVENRLGVGSIVGAEACARATPDGYTLCVLDSFTLTLNPHVRLKLAYDPQKDFSPIVMFGFLRSSISVNPSLPANSVSELLALAKAKPGSLVWGSFGPASSSHFYIEWFKSKGIEFLNIPYKAASEAMQRLVAGEVNVVTFSFGQSVGLAKGGKIKMLAVGGDTRSALMPDVPSYKEAGMDFTIQTWFGLYAPGGAPNDIVQRLNAELVKIIPSPAYRDKVLTTQGIDIIAPAAGPIGPFAAYIKEETEMYGRLTKLVGIKPE
ncbi:MAG: Bug family tripartite tricarboxylate transporter substrate binding protein [Burkholderiales bacterium]